MRYDITKDGLTLDGGGTAVLEGADRDGDGDPDDVVTISGAQNVMLMGLTVQNGRTGIIIERGAAATLTNVTAQDNNDEGIDIRYRRHC